MAVSDDKLGPNTSFTGDGLLDLTGQQTSTGATVTENNPATFNSSQVS